MLTYVLQLIVAGMVMGSIYALVALSYNIIFSTTNIINFGQGEMVMMGAMVTLAFVAWGLPLYVAFAAAVAFVALLGLAYERVAYRPAIRQAHGVSWIISTLAVGIILQNLAMIIWGKEPLPFPALFPQVNFTLGGVVFDSSQILIFVAALLLAVIIEGFLAFTYIGKAIKATSYKREAAEYMGINTSLVIIFCFALSGTLSAAAGILVSPITFASANMGLIIGLKGFAAAILGGLGSGRGAILGGLSLGIVEIFGGVLISGGFRDITAFLFLILVLLVKPEGLFGKLGLERA